MNVGIIGNRKKDATGPAVESLLAAVRDRGFNPLADERLSDLQLPGLSADAYLPLQEMIERADVVVAFGGDGTMLAAGRAIAGTGTPLIGVNLGKLGFLAEFSVDQLPETLDELAGGNCTVDERILLRADFPEAPDKDPLLALNDIVIDKREDRLMVHLEVRVDGEFLGRFSADGLILATPTGSTAYALAVGGPVVAPHSDVMVIAPIAPHMLTARPVVVPADSEVEIRPIALRGTDDSVHVFADGQNHSFLKLPTRITITCPPDRVKLVKRKSRTYFDVLRAKLFWGRQPVLEGETSSGDESL